MNIRTKDHATLQTVKNFIKHEKIITTYSRGINVQRFLEKLITRVKRAINRIGNDGGLEAIRSIHSKLILNRVEEKKYYTNKLIKMAHEYNSRPGGYVSRRNMKISKGRKTVLLKLMKDTEGNDKDKEKNNK